MMAIISSYYLSFEVWKEGLLLETVKRFPAWVTANHITHGRIFLALAVWYFYQNSLVPRLIPFFLGVSVVSDLFDGPLARVRQQESVYGANLDPIADKFAILPVIYYELFDFTPIFVICMIAGEIISTILRFVAFTCGFDAKAVSYGKWKMLLQTLALVPIFAGWQAASCAILVPAFLLGLTGLFSQSCRFLK